MKNILISLVVMFIVATFFIIGEEREEKVVVKNDQEEIVEKRAIYFSYIELSSYINGKEESIQKKNIDSIIDNLARDKFNMLILHVRPFSDSIYPSKIYPSSRYVVSIEGNSFEFDILEYFIKKAHEKKIEVHAWVNPYRIRNSNDTSKLDNNNIYNRWKDTDNVKVIDGKGIFLNPASHKVQDLIVSGIEEIVRNYDVDGIHFDDYFYPDKTIDLESYENYKKSGGVLSLEEYRLDNVRTLIKKVYSSIKRIKKDVEFGIAPEGNIDNNYTSNYLDTKRILKEDGYVDYIMPQIYYGFNNSNKPFIKTVKEWNSYIKNKKIKLIPALALYKSGNIDKYALNGKDEWLNNCDIVKRQIVISRNLSSYKGFSIFRYDNFYKPDNSCMEEEGKSLRKVLK